MAHSTVTIHGETSINDSHYINSNYYTIIHIFSPSPAHTRPWINLLNILHAFDFILSLFMNFTLSLRPINAVSVEHLTFIFHSPYIYREFTRQELLQMLLYGLSDFHKNCEINIFNLMLNRMKLTFSGVN